MATPEVKADVSEVFFSSLFFVYSFFPHDFCVLLFPFLLYLREHRSCGRGNGAEIVEALKVAAIASENLLNDFFVFYF